MRTTLGLGLVLVMAAACGKGGTPDEGSKAAPQAPAPPAGEAAPAPTGALQVRVDPRIELISILERLAGGQEYSQGFASPYRDAVDAHFAKFRDHAAVTMTASLRKSHGITFNAPMDLAIHVDETWKPRVPLSPLPAEMDPRWKGAPIDDYLAAVRDFAHDSGAAAFFASHKAYFDAVDQSFRGLLDRAKALPWFDGFYGARPAASYIVVPGLLTGGSNYGAHAELPGGHEERYQVVMLEDTDAKGIPHPGTQSERLLVHEMAHSYVNPVVDRHAVELAPSEKLLFAMVAQPMASQAYKSWDVIIKESLVRATTILFIRDHDGEAAAQRETYQQMDNGFYWMPELVALLAKEHAHGLDAAMPAVEKVLETWAAAHPKGPPAIPFAGPINAAFSRIERGMKATLVVPHGQPALAKFAGAVRTKLMPQVAQVEATASTWKQLDGQAIVAYGSRASNPVVAHILDENGWSAGAYGVKVAGQNFLGPHMVLIACHARTEDPQLPVVVYAAADDADLVGVNGGVFHGPTDWVVARRTAPGKYTVLAQGNFE